jgi:lipid II:glycine glycyltransferase (peptidoglycan interpeptide bridge formation enzyme)
LRPDLDELFRSFDKDSVQRRIHRAERAGLIEKRGRSEELLKEFYALFVITRGRHRLPPTPYAWFQTLINCLDETLEIRLAYKEKTPISAILTLRCKDAVYYKYGSSDARFNKLGATPWLLWRAIAAGKSNGATKFDMGRTEEENAGLLTFKNHWVAQPQRLVYWRFPDLPTDSVNGWKLKMAKHVFSFMPDGLRTMAGKLIYRHIG